jgi:hypothetical protein
VIAFNVYLWRLETGEMGCVWSGEARNAGEAIRQAKIGRPNLASAYLVARRAKNDPYAGAPYYD